MSAVATVPAAGFKVIRTVRDTWHVINQFNGDHWEDPNQAAVTASIDLYNENTRKREEARRAAEEAAKNPQAAEFGTMVPGEPVAFETYVPVAQAGKPNAPTVATPEAGGAPEPDAVQAPNTVTLTDEQFQALLAKAGTNGAEPEPEEVAPQAVARDN